MRSAIVQTHKLFYLKVFVALSFIIYWCYQTYINKLVGDDLIMIHEVHQRGIINTMWHFYDGWNTRWITYLWQGLWYQQWNNNSSPWLYNMITLIALIGSSMFLLKSFTPEIKPKLHFYINSILLSAAITLSTYNIYETWFWVSGSTMYGWNLIAANITLACLRLKFKAIYIPLIIICGLYIGGASEPFTMGIICTGVMILLFRRQSIITNKRLILLLSCVCLSFLFAYTGTGHSIRRDALPHYTIAELVIRIGYFYLKLIFFHSPLRILVIITLLYLLMSRNKWNAENKRRLFQNSTAIFKSLSIWLIWTLLHILLLCYLMGSYGPSRSWSSISWMAVVLTLHFYFSEGNNGKSCAKKGIGEGRV